MLIQSIRYESLCTNAVSSENPARVLRTEHTFFSSSLSFIQSAISKCAISSYFVFSVPIAYSWRWEIQLTIYVQCMTSSERVDNRIFLNLLSTIFGRERYQIGRYIQYYMIKNDTTQLDGQRRGIGLRERAKEGGKGGENLGEQSEVEQLTLSLSQKNLTKKINI